MNIVIFGTGTFGVALGCLLSKNKHKVTMWSVFDEEIDYLSNNRTHKNLPGCKIPKNIVFTSDLQIALRDKQMVVFAVPSPYVRSTIEKVVPYLNNDMILVDVAKGIEKNTYFTMSQIISEVIKKHKLKCDIVALSGPTHAEEVAIGIPTLIVAASKSVKASKKVQETFMNDYFRVYTNKDIIGCEVCGAFKNILALACGISTGVGYGDNTKAAIMTRGMTEMIKLGKKMGCNKKTFYGLAGIGDLIVTATSEHSRNNTCGKYIGEGLSVDKAIKKVGMVVEGINALGACVSYMKKYNIEMPITEGMDLIINKGASPKKIMNVLMTRKEKEED